MKTVPVIRFNELPENCLFQRQDFSGLDIATQIIVEETHCAILIKDGKLINTLDEGRYNVFEKNERNTIVEIVYMSKTQKHKAFWGTRSKLNMRDPATKMRISIGFSGSYEVRIKEPRKFFKELIGSGRFYDMDMLEDRLLDRILENVEPVIAEYMDNNKISYTEFDSNRNNISKSLGNKIKDIFEQEYGLELTAFGISNSVLTNETIQEVENQVKIMINGSERNSQNTSSMFCPECGRAYLPGKDRFCSGCGHKFTGSVICPSCNYSNDENNRFCSKCGNQIKF